MWCVQLLAREILWSIAAISTSIYCQLLHSNTNHSTNESTVRVQSCMEAELYEGAVHENVSCPRLYINAKPHTMVCSSVNVSLLPV
jgi:hypothetical protein